MNLKVQSILKTDNIIRKSRDSKLAEAASHFQSSHDAVMVMDEDQFLGVISPYYAILKRPYPPSTKLDNCLFSPPKLNMETSLAEVARLMLESKVHYLPVLDDANRLLGLATARRILGKFLEDDKSKATVGDLIANKRYLQTINLGSNFEEVLRFFQRTKLSKIVIVDEHHHLEGIIALFDLLPLYMEPKERKPLLDQSDPVSAFSRATLKQFLKTSTIKVRPSQNLHEVIKLILDKEIGSVIVMKDTLTPENIITTSDILRYFLS